MHSFDRPRVETALSAAPVSLWGLLTRGEFSSEAARADAEGWVREVAECWPSVTSLAVDLGWRDSWRIRLTDLLARRVPALRPELCYHLNADALRVFGGDPPADRVRGSGEDAVRARLRFLQLSVFEGSTKRMAEALTGRPLPREVWAGLDRQTRLMYLWRRLDAPLKAEGVHPARAGYAAFQALTDDEKEDAFLVALAVQGAGDGPLPPDAEAVAGRVRERAEATAEGEATSVSKSRLQRVLFGDVQVSPDVVEAAVAMGVNRAWLATGEAEPFEGDFAEAAERFARRTALTDSRGDRYIKARRETEGLASEHVTAPL